MYELFCWRIPAEHWLFDLCKLHRWFLCIFFWRDRMYGLFERFIPAQYRVDSLLKLLFGHIPDEHEFLSVRCL